MTERTTYLKDASEEPRQITVTLPAREYAALVYLRDTTFPGKSYELMCRKLIQDGLLACGVLELRHGNRGKAAGRR